MGISSTAYRSSTHLKDFQLLSLQRSGLSLQTSSGTVFVMLKLESTGYNLAGFRNLEGIKLQLEPSQVLIVDADEQFRRSLFGAIRRAGYETAVACDETEALTLISQTRFPLIIIDLWQAGRSAVNLVQQIRGASPSSQIVVMTPYHAGEFCAELGDLDIFECVRKPVKRNSLLEVVARALARKKE